MGNLTILRFLINCTNRKTHEKIRLKRVNEDDTDNETKSTSNYALSYFDHENIPFVCKEKENSTNMI